MSTQHATATPVADRGAARPHGPDLPVVLGGAARSTITVDEAMATIRGFVVERRDLLRERDDLRAALDATTRALDEQRPAPDPRRLGQQLRHAWFRSRRPGEASDGYRNWTSVAETAIDIVRGLWPDEPVDVGVCPRCLSMGLPIDEHRICILCEDEVGVRAAAVTR